jgi:hypothetical protein
VLPLNLPDPLSKFPCCRATAAVSPRFYGNDKRGSLGTFMYVHLFHSIIKTQQRPDQKTAPNSSPYYFYHFVRCCVYLTVNFIYRLLQGLYYICYCTQSRTTQRPCRHISSLTHHSFILCRPCQAYLSSKVCTYKYELPPPASWLLV